ncbi:MAG: ribonucleoside-diphosphate reductase, adenosylcobalamin-dependent, partial [Pseudomonadota bacterium]
AMQAAAQKWIDSSISKTINCPEDISFEDFKAVYMQAWDQGCKGCTTYRPNDVTGSVLSVDSEAHKAEPIEMGASSEPMDRPEVLEGITYKLKWPLSEHAMYITINDVMVDGRRQPFEVFVNSKNMEHYAWTLALTRMISAVFRRGGDVSFVVEELKAVFDPRGGAWMEGAYIPSILAAIGGVIEEHLVAIGLVESGAIGLADGTDGNVVKLQTTGGGKTCEACGAPGMRMVEGCMTCMSCGYSKCG